MTLIQVSVVSGDRLRADSALRSEMAGIAAPSYCHTTTLLAREFARCHQAYTGRLGSGELVCLFLSNRLSIEVNGELISGIYLGLSISHAAYKGLGPIALLWRQCLKDAWTWQQELDREVLLAATTATPVIYEALTFLSRYEPKPDGTYSARGAAIATALGKSITGRDQDAAEHPFVLKGVATDTEYSDAERQRISEFRQRRGFTLFERLGVHEEQFDRLICFGYLPDHVERWFESPARVGADAASSAEG